MTGKRKKAVKNAKYDDHATRSSPALPRKVGPRMVDEVGLEALEGLWLVGCCMKTMALIGRGHARGKGRQ